MVAISSPSGIHESLCWSFPANRTGNDGLRPHHDQLGTTDVAREYLGEMKMRVA